MTGAKMAWISSRNIKRMYERGDGHVHVLAASIRSVDHLLCSFALGAELATVPGKVLEEWSAAGFPLPDRGFSYKGVDSGGKPLKAIGYQDLDLERQWGSFDIAHELTTKGIKKFVADYEKTLIEPVSTRRAETPDYRAASLTFPRPSQTGRCRRSSRRAASPQALSDSPSANRIPSRATSDAGECAMPAG